LANYLEAFLKTSFKEHRFICCATNPEFSCATGNSTKKQKCATCTLSQVVMQYLKEHTEEIHHGLLEECREKLA
jgi:hypothetical protein